MKKFLIHRIVPFKLRYSSFVAVVQLTLFNSLLLPWHAKRYQRRFSARLYQQLAEEDKGCVDGWDPVTGLGTPIYPELLMALAELEEDRSHPRTDNKASMGEKYE